MPRDLLTSLFYPPYTRWGATGAESERAGSSTSRAESCRVSIRCGHNNARSPGPPWRPMVDDPPEPQEEKYPPPREQTGPQAFPSTFVIPSC